MTQPTLFSSGIDLANLVVSSELLHQSWIKTLELYRETNHTDPNLPPSVRYNTYTHPLYGTIVAFVSSPICALHHLQGEGRDLISSETLKREGFPCFEFLSTKRNQVFSIHKAAIFIFQSLCGGLSDLKRKLDITKPLIITGHSIGGSIASLFTLWLLESIPPKVSRRPLCITFGSPLVGDNGFQQAILERPTWTSCFLHVASNSDPIPKLFVSTSQNGSYQPFGTFLLCSEYGSACFEQPESISELLMAMRSDSVGNQNPSYYTRILDNVKCKAICKGSSGLSGSISTLRGGILTQLEAIGVNNLQHWGNSDINALISKIEGRTSDSILEKRTAFNPNKKLNDRKINMAYLEWYKKFTTGNRGYYDSYKTVRDQTRETIIVHHKRLTLYWKTMVAEAEKMPQKEGASFHTRWLYAGTAYRRMVEPLDIADYYKKGNKREYKTRGRSEHYVTLEKWLNDAKSSNDAIVRNAACSLTEDSCFWAHVEEAMVSCRLLEGRETSEEDKEWLRVKLTDFDQYAMDLIRGFGVSTEVFLEQSSFMQWWKEYDRLMGASCSSELIDFMRQKRHQQYA